MREIDLDSWGQALLEEILFRGGREVSERSDEGAPLDLQLTVRIVADADNDRIEIQVPSVTDETLVTYLPRPF